MAYPPLKPNEIALIREVYEEEQNVTEVERRTGFSRPTIYKYVGSGRKKQLRDSDVIRAFRLTGSVKSTARLLKVHHKTVWRRLTRMGFVLTLGARDSRRLYRALRKRVNESQWRQDVLVRDGAVCVRCGEASDIVHHTYHLADMRDRIFLDHPEIDPFASRRELVCFIDLVMALHKLEHGETLCQPCHSTEHSSNGGST